MAYLIRIGEVKPITPMKCDLTKSDIYSDSSERSAETGYLMLYPIRRDVYTLELEFLGTPAEIEAIESQLDTKTSVVIDENEDGNETTKYMYASDRNKIPEGTADSRKYRLTFSLIER